MWLDSDGFKTVLGGTTRGWFRWASLIWIPGLDVGKASLAMDTPSTSQTVATNK